MKKIISQFLVIVAVWWGFTGCSLNVPPPDQYADPDAISNVTSARAFLASCYISYPHYEYDLSVMGNDFCPTSLSGKDVNELNVYNWQNKDLSTLADGVWQNYYTCIANCDVLLERESNIATGTTDEAEKKKAIIAEAKTLKAMAYFDLLRLFATRYSDNADAPGVVIKSQFGYETQPRSTKRQCVSYINALLANAAAADVAQSTNGWLSSLAAEYVQAEVSIYAGDYTAALTHATAVMNACNDSYLTPEAFQRLWRTDSYGGRIFAFSTKSAFYTTLQYDAAQGDLYALNPAMAFSTADGRRATSVYPMVMNGEERALFGKYNLMNKQGISPVYINRMRFAGAYLMAAEAQARLGNDSEARTTINHYLSLMGAEPLTESVTGEALINAIVDETCREFVGEGQNWFTLKRCGRSLPRLTRWGKGTASTIAPTDYRWTLPIPDSERRYNEQVSQNAGW